MAVQENRETLRDFKNRHNVYFVGPFWILGESVSDINAGTFGVASFTFLTDYNGNLIENEIQKDLPEDLSFPDMWAKRAGKCQKSFNYYPHGKVTVKEGKIEVFIPEVFLKNEDIIRHLGKVYDFNLDNCLLTPLDMRVDMHKFELN